MVKTAEAYLEPCQTSNMERLVGIFDVLATLSDSPIILNGLPAKAFMRSLFQTFSLERLLEFKALVLTVSEMNLLRYSNTVR